MPALTLGAIGVAFGDIGTSPLHEFRKCLKAAGGVSPTNVYGIVSLIPLSIIVVVTLKYVCFVMRADNDWEGGVLALTALEIAHSLSDSLATPTQQTERHV
ncbi:potassium uptake protein [Caballeronia arationis]|nr:KUP/HAK/KT family potassium transporter [Caballeronia arationis]SAL04861.1 potassium uptake protein [Caballeronia arationis]